VAKGGKAKRTRRPPASTSTAELDATVRRLTAPTPSDRRWVPNDEDEAPPVTEARPRRIWRSRTAPNHAGRVVPLHSYDPHAWQIACRCGWRSRAYRSPPSAFIDGPRNYQLNDPAAEEAARLLWREHAGASDTEIALGLEPHDDKLPIAGVGDRYSDDADRPYEDEGEDD
jgi:hypothetical protein